MEYDLISLDLWPRLFIFSLSQYLLLLSYSWIQGHICNILKQLLSISPYAATVFSVHIVVLKPTLFRVCWSVLNTDLTEGSGVNEVVRAGASGDTQVSDLLGLGMHNVTEEVVKQ